MSYEIHREHGELPCARPVYKYPGRDHMHEIFTINSDTDAFLFKVRMQHVGAGCYNFLAPGEKGRLARP